MMMMIDEDEEEEEEVADEAPNQDEDDEGFNSGDDMIPDGQVIEHDGEPYEANENIVTASKIVRSQARGVAHGEEADAGASVC